MTKKDSELLEPIKKNEGDINYLDVLKQLVSQKQAELQAIIGKITQYKTQIITLENRLRTVESDSNNKINRDKQELEKTRQKKMNEFMNRDNLLQKGETDIAKRKMAIEEQEQTIEKARVEKNKLINERLRYEQLNREIVEKSNSAVRLSDEALEKLHQATDKETKADKMLKEAQSVKSSSDKQLEDIELKKKELEVQTVNLEKIREDVTPKIEEYNKLVISNEAQLKLIALREKELEEKSKENNDLLDKANAAARVNKQKEIELKTMEASLVPTTNSPGH